MEPMETGVWMSWASCFSMKGRSCPFTTWVSKRKYPPARTAPARAAPQSHQERRGFFPMGPSGLNGRGRSGRELPGGERQLVACGFQDHGLAFLDVSFQQFLRDGVLHVFLDHAFHLARSVGFIETLLDEEVPG